MTVDVEQLTYTEIMPYVGQLAGELLDHPDQDVRGNVEELLDWIDVFHREGLNRVVDLIKAWRGEIFLEQVEQDEIIGPFLAAYDLTEAEFPIVEENGSQPSAPEAGSELPETGDFI